MQDNCWFGDLWKDEKRKSQLNMNWEDLWVSMQYPYLWAISTCITKKPGGLSFGIIEEECGLTI